MPANLWELRADLRPLDTAAQAWRDVAEVMTRRGDEIVEAARRATDGWEAAAADGYEQHRRHVLAHLDLFTSLAAELSASLQAVGAVLSAAQEELDRSWTRVAMVPHETVGESRHLVLHPAEEHRGTVARAQQEAEEIRGRLGAALEHEGGRLRAARAELDVVRSGLATLAGGRFPGGWAAGEDGAVRAVTSGTSSSTSVPGAAQAGVGALLPVAPGASVVSGLPDLAGLASSGLALSGLAAGATAASGRRAAARRSAPTGPPPVGGVGAGAVGARAGSMSAGRAGGRAGARRMPAPVPQAAGGARGAGGAVEDEEAQARSQSEKDTKRALLEEKRAERAARRARRRAEAREDRDEPEAADGPDEPAAAVADVHHAPGEDPEA